MFYSIVLTIFCATIISAALPPRDVYSAVIVNAKGSSVQCQIKWSEPKAPITGSSSQIENVETTEAMRIEHLNSYIAPERRISMGSWTAGAVITKIICGDLSISAPFPGVNSPSKNWRFRVEKDRIVSVGSQ